MLRGAGPEQSRAWPRAGQSGLVIDAGKGQICECCPRGGLMGKILSAQSSPVSAFTLDFLSVRVVSKLGLKCKQQLPGPGTSAAWLVGTGR